MPTLTTALKGAARPRQCALLFPDGNDQRVLGGGSHGFGYPGNHRTDFFIAATAVARRPFVGIRLFFPTKEVPYAKFSTTEGHREPARLINIMLHAGTFTSAAEVLSAADASNLPPRTNPKDKNLAIFRFKLNDDKRAAIEGFGMPVICENAEDQAILDDDAPVDGVMSLRKLCHQTEFVVLVQGFNAKMPEYVNNQLRDFFGSGQPEAPWPYINGDWDMGRYGAEIARYNGELEYNAAIRFDNGYDCAVTISQSVVQDVFHFIQDVRDIREHRVECEFLRIKPGSCDARAPQFTVLVWHRLNMKKYGTTLTDLLTRSVSLSLAFEESPENREDHNCWRARNISMAKYQSTGADLALTIFRPCTEDDHGPRNQRINAFDSHDEANKVAGEFYLKFDDEEDQAKRRVDAIRPLWQNWPLHNNVDEVLPAYHKALLNVWKADLLAGSGFPSLVSPRAPLDGRTTGPGPDLDDIEQVKEAIGRLWNSKVDIFSFRESEQVLPHIRDGIDGEMYGRFRQYMEVSRLGVIPITGPARSITTKMASNIALLFIMAIGPVFAAAPTHVATTNFAERLFRVGSEIFGKLEWKVPLVIRGYNVWKELNTFETLSVGASTSHLADGYIILSQSQLHLSCCWWMLKVIGAKGYGLESNDPDALFELRMSFLEDPRFESLRRYLDGRLGWRQPLAGGGDAPLNAARNLLKAVVMRAQAVCTTPQTCVDGNAYAKFNDDVARGVVLDDAGAMHTADALHIWGWGCRPCVLAGDPTQPQPMFVKTHERYRNGQCMNMFSKYGKLSVLKRVERVGWPCFEV